VLHIAAERFQGDLMGNDEGEKRENHKDQVTSKRQRRAALRAFKPLREVIFLSGGQVTIASRTTLSSNLVGWKAYGLSCLPPEWVPEFFVLENVAVNHANSGEPLETAIAECLRSSGIGQSDVLVRSSGTSETIDQRGRLVSKACSSAEILQTIHELSSKISPEDAENVHWIIQKHIRPARKGHLSNERRLSREPRDFVTEFERQDDQPGYTVPIAVRHWRDGATVTDFDLSCGSQPGVTLKLKRVAMWATALPARILFEWVWDGTKVWIVQADLAGERKGINPNDLRPAEIPQILPENLSAFRIVGEAEFARYGKLRNAKTYIELGYKMPVFYILDDAALIRQISEGTIPQSVEYDLEELTRRPLIIRTDGTDIPKDKREMLPRSEGLRSAADAKGWLIEKFAREIAKIGIAQAALCLIAHHFIPSAAAAWARAEPNQRVIRIESLWGLPEGLYWHSHDTFEVDTANNYAVRKRLRFKGTFVAPDTTGQWVHYQPASPFDWGASIVKTAWLTEIAKTTRLVADHDKHAVAVMWFIDNDQRATAHQVLPWYHAESAIGAPKAAPRRKLTMASDFKIETMADWENLKSRVQAGRMIERIMLEPRDPELLRNQDFARQLAEFAAQNRIVVELAGGVLSHAYFILQRHGAHVECVDLFGAEEEEIQFNKIVRDKIPESIQKKGESVEVVRLKGEALLAALRRKLVEESFEALDARSGDDLIAELADVEEVIQGICETLQIPREQVAQEQAEKRKRRGGFKRGIMLRSTSTPHSLPRRPLESQEVTLYRKEQDSSAAIENASAIPANPPYRRPDLRNVDQQTESLLTFETELNRMDAEKQSMVFEVPIGENQTQKVSVSIELKRNKSSLWSQVRVKPEPSQLRLVSDLQMDLNFLKDLESTKPTK
jgi:predicted house-cleaning noncanonical NTP pyrophosphatase (MazG superfamily)